MSFLRNKLTRFGLSILLVVAIGTACEPAPYCGTGTTNPGVFASPGTEWLEYAGHFTLQSGNHYHRYDKWRAGWFENEYVETIQYQCPGTPYHTGTPYSP